MTSPGLDNEENMSKAVDEFGWPDTMVHAVDRSGSLWSHFGTRFRGTWIMVNQDGRELSRSAGHISKDDLIKRLDQLTSE